MIINTDDYLYGTDALEAAAEHGLRLNLGTVAEMALIAWNELEEQDQDELLDVVNVAKRDVPEYAVLLRSRYLREQMTGVD